MLRWRWRADRVVMRSTSTLSLSGRYGYDMCLTRLRGFAWLLALVLFTGLAMPLFAPAPASAHRHATAHVHADVGLSDDHSHAKSPNTNSHHGNLDLAERILGHHGIALPDTVELTLPILLRVSFGRITSSQLFGRSPDQDIDPPRRLTHR